MATTRYSRASKSGENEGQRIFIVHIRDYAWLVPFVETETEIFLKTIIPSRKATAQYLRGGKSDDSTTGN
jgi:hypothetical protein